VLWFAAHALLHMRPAPWRGLRLWGRGAGMHVAVARSEPFRCVPPGAARGTVIVAACALAWLACLRGFVSCGGVVSCAYSESDFGEFHWLDC
jgi:hypothetical protein